MARLKIKAILREDEFALVRAVEIARGIVEGPSQERAKRKPAERARKGAS